MISDFLPLQWWLAGDTVYNDLRPEMVNVEGNQYVHEIACADPVGNMFADLGISDYAIKGKDCDGNIIVTLPLVKESFGGTDGSPEVIETIVFPVITDWIDRENNYGAWVAPYPTIYMGATLASIQTSSDLYVPYSFIPGRTYNITVNLQRIRSGAGASTSRQTTLFIANSLFASQFSSVVSPSDVSGTLYSVNLEFVATDQCLNVCIKHTEVQTGGAYSQISLQSTDDMTETTPEIPSVPDSYSTYKLSFIPLDNGLCGKEIRFEMYKDADLLYATDTIRFVLNPIGTVVIQYKGSKPFDGIPYDVDSDYLTLRIKAKFFKGRGVEEVKSEELPESVIDTASILKKQMKLFIDDCPDYLHLKIQGVLQHAVVGSVLINGYEWSRGAEYEYIERDSNGTEEYPLQAAQIWLTRKNYVKRSNI